MHASQTPGVSMTWKIDNYGPTRDHFTSFGQLDNTSDTNYRAISNGSPAFAFALDLGTINQTSNSLVFGIGLVRDPVLKYQTGTTNQSLKHLWSTRWSDVGAAVGDQFAEALTLHTYWDRLTISSPDPLLPSLVLLSWITGSCPAPQLALLNSA